MAEDGWLTTAEAMQAGACSDRKLQRWAKRGLLEARSRPGKETLYSAAGVARLAAAGRTVHQPTISPLDGNGNGRDPRTALERAAYAPAADQLLGPALRFLERLTAVLPDPPTPPTGPTAVSHLSIVSLAQAEAESGWPQKELRRFIRAGTLVPVCGRSSRTWRIRRRDLEGL